jgi:hypothetical protein
MVQAILEGRKTQTRRVIKPQPKSETSCFGWKTPEYTHVAFGNSFRIESMHRNPFGDPGDLLYVRETMILNKYSNTYWPVADGYVKTSDYEKTTPSIHMPKTTARIWLEIEQVKVERLQDISEEDAKAEGLKSRFSVFFQEERYDDYLDMESEYRSPVSSFQSLWQKINGGESWDANPWVWVVKFKVLSTKGKPETLNSKL